jgi:hypothetical protein
MANILLNMNRLLPLVLAVVLLPANGCISTHMVKTKAMIHREYDPQQAQDREVPGQPGYYALLPFTIIADAVVWPFYLAFGPRSSGGYVSVDGWPIPVP